MHLSVFVFDCIRDLVRVSVDRSRRAVCMHQFALVCGREKLKFARCVGENLVSEPSCKVEETETGHVMS